VTPPLRVGAVVPAAGRGERFGGTVPKALTPLRGRPLVRYSLDVLQAVREVETIVVVVPAESVGAVQALVRDAGLDKISAVVPGGQDRQASVRAGLSALPPGPDLVLVHDGARPFVSAALVRAVLIAAARDGGATAAIPVNETVKSADAGWVQATLDRSQLYRVQTPQAFGRALLETAHTTASRDGFRGTDDASLVERLGHRVRLVPGSPSNVKVTVPEDLLLVDALLRGGDSPPPAPRVGIGFDAHRFMSGRPLMLGGVDIPSPRGLAGHSDADVVVHAIMDALLGAAGCGDIGVHFPPEDPAFASARSLALLSQVRDMLASRGWRAAHVDVMVMAEFPRLTPHVPAMRAAIATALGVGEDHVNVKATTLEGMGAIGRREGIAAQAVASLEPLVTQALDGAR
jgi:2-C-methyl-D-erythritol 4-phosphate cytidylyltransferase/2-C-methyl-D-erythritol 2,4-cyclodiphosphate synthase